MSAKVSRTLYVISLPMKKKQLLCRMLKEVLEMPLIEIDWCGLCDVSIPAMHCVLFGLAQMTCQP